jgi:hypothetical protein
MREIIHHYVILCTWQLEPLAAGNGDMISFRSRDRAPIDQAVMQSRKQCKESYNQTDGKKEMQ